MKTAAFRKPFLPVVHNIHVFDVEKLWLFSMFGVQKRTRIKEMTNDICVSTFDKNGRWRNHACVDKNGKPKNFISKLKLFFGNFSLITIYENTLFTYFRSKDVIIPTKYSAFNKPSYRRFSTDPSFIQFPLKMRPNYEKQK